MKIPSGYFSIDLLSLFRIINSMNLQFLTSLISYDVKNFQLTNLHSVNENNSIRIIPVSEMKFVFAFFSSFLPVDKRKYLRKHL